MLVYDLDTDLRYTVREEGFMFLKNHGGANYPQPLKLLTKPCISGGIFSCMTGDLLHGQEGHCLSAWPT